MFIAVSIKTMLYIWFLYSKEYPGALRFIALPADFQSIKSDKQIKTHYNLVKTYFNSTSKFHVLENMDSNVFMYLDGNKLASFIQVVKSQCYSQTNKSAITHLSIYCVTVPDAYRGFNLGAKLFIDSIDFMCKRYKLPSNTIISLHISPDDKCMPVASIIYYKLGFHKGIYSNNKNSEYMYNIDTMINKSKDLFESIKNPEEIYGEGFYYMTHCRLADFNKSYKLPDNSTISTVEKFQNILKERKKRIDSSNK